MRLSLPVLLMLSACGGASSATISTDSTTATAGDEVRVRVIVTTPQGGVRMGAKVTFSAPAPAELSTTSAETNELGIAETRVKLNEPGSVTVTATVDGDDYTTTITFKAADPGPVVPTGLKFENQPVDPMALYPNKFLRDGSNNPIQVAVVGADGARATESTASITIGVTGCTATLHQNSAKTIAAQQGVATFSGLSFGAGGTGCRLTASASGLTAAESATFDVTAP